MFKGKRLKNYFIALFAVLVFTVFLCPTVKARGSGKVSISSFTSKVNIMKDGSLAVEEELTMGFDGSFNGGFKDISVKDTGGITDLKVYSIEDGIQKEFMYKEDAQNKVSGVYNVKQENSNMYRVKIYIPSKNITRKFKITYNLKDCAKLYNDVGELNYNFWDRGYNSKIGDFKGYIILPEEVPMDKLKAFVQGPTNSKVSILDGRTIVVSSSKVSDSDYITGRVVFPKELIKDSKNVINEDGLKRILEEEESYKISVQNKIASFNKKSYIFKFVSLGVTVLDVLLIAFFIKITKRNDLDSVYILPKQYTPAVVSIIYKRYLNEKDFTATLLDLNRKGCIEINKIYDKKGKEDYEITMLNKNRDELSEHERYFLNWILEYCGYNDSITMKEIEKICKKDVYKFRDKFNKWNKLVSDEANKKGIFDKTNGGNGAMYIFLSCVQIVISCFAIHYAGIYGGLSMVMSVTLFILGLVLLNRLSDLGYREKLKWKKIKAEFERGDYLLASSRYPLNEYFPCLVTLGVSVKCLEKFRRFTLQSGKYIEDLWLINYFNFDNFINGSSFIYFAGGSFSSSISAGTSSGGGGGCGGGGAGGF